MKYKKRSSQKKKQRQRHRFSKKYAIIDQHGGGFMDVIPGINAMEGRTNTCMAVHPTQPLVAVGDDAGTITLWEINPAQPKKLAQLTGLPTSVKCVEFHKTLPVVAAACSDMVLMWRIDQTDIDKPLEPLQVVSVSVESEEKVNEVSCFSFHPSESYIAVGVNNNKIIIYGFKIEPSSSVKLYSLPTVFRSEGSFARALEKVLFISFSSDGRLFSFVTIKSDGIPVLKVVNFKGGDNRYMLSEYSIYEIRKKCTVTCITPYRTSVGFHNGSFYRFAGMMHTHGFIIGCDDGSLMLIEAVTIYARQVGFTRVETVRKSKEWNFREAIECVAVHPSLPLFASGSRNAIQLWDESKREPEPLVVQPQVTPVISVGFNENFLTACGTGNVHIYSCNADDYRGFREKLQKELQSGPEIANYGTDVTLANRRGEVCIVCGEPMNDPLSQPALRSGPEEAQEIYLTCGHKFHNNDLCIKKWINKGGKCPLCNQTRDFEVGTPQRILNLRKEAMTERMAKSIIDTNEKRFMRALDFGQGAATASSAPEDVVEAVPASAVLTPEELRVARLAYFSKQPPPSENSGGGKKNKYSRKKYSSKKSKIRHRYSKKYKY
jgi:WD40 repeat protein